MSKEKVTPTASAVDLHKTVEVMDCLAQDGFDAITAIAKLALHRMESTNFDMEIIAQALTIIWHKADDISNCISSEADSVGASSVNAAQQRRLEARQQARGVQPV